MRLGTRGSALALAQARWVAERLGGEEEVEIVTVSTAGDRGELGEDRSRWVKELELSLLEGEIDLAVHSAKDVPADLLEGLAVVGVPGRADPRDALCGASSIDALERGARVGTSSQRRCAQLRALRPDLEVVALRGNVDTRLRKLRESHCAAIVLAQAGLDRLGRGEEAGAALDLVPAPGQGTLLLEGRDEDGSAREIASRATDAGAARALTAERALARALGASCHTPLGALAERDGAGLRLRAWLGMPDGSAWMADELTGEEPGALGDEVGRRMLAAGARDLLGAAERAAGGPAAPPPAATPEGQVLG
ncbi:MAG: hydroxymethylbilane synthase [Solirubrobacteraceae bacterium]|nr:hydroxymethylbilane synthase [Solirubrobacteraceae bacterium]